MKNASDIRVLLVENETDQSNLTLYHLDKIGVSQVGVASNYMEAIQLFQTYCPDVVILDIDLGEEKNGIDVARFIKSKNATPIIFITSNYRPDVYEQARELEPHAFMDRGFDSIRLRQSLELAVGSNPLGATVNGSSPTDSSDFYVKIGTQFRKISPEEILWVEVDGRYSAIKTLDGRKTLVNSSLRDSVKKLPQATFIRVHKSYIVNLSKIESVDMHSGTIFIGHEEIPIGRNFKKDILDRINVF